MSLDAIRATYFFQFFLFHRINTVVVAVDAGRCSAESPSTLPLAGAVIYQDESRPRDEASKRIQKLEKERKQVEKTSSHRCLFNWKRKCVCKLADVVHGRLYIQEEKRARACPSLTHCTAKWITLDDDCWQYRKQLVWEPRWTSIGSSSCGVWVVCATTIRPSQGRLQDDSTSELQKASVKMKCENRRITCNRIYTYVIGSDVCWRRAQPSCKIYWMKKLARCWNCHQLIYRT